MKDSFGLSLDELLLSLRRKGIPIQFEVGAFVVLEACEAVIERPVSIDCADLTIDDTGLVLVNASASRATSEEAMRSLIEVLSELMLASAHGIPEALLQLVEHGPSDATGKLARLKDDLQASLVPLNRSAARRVLARLVREAKKEGDREIEQPELFCSRVELDHEFDELFGRSTPDKDGVGADAVDPGSSISSGSVRIDIGGNHTQAKEADGYAARSNRREPGSERPIDETAPGGLSKSTVRISSARKPSHTDDFIGLEEKRDNAGRTAPRLVFTLVGAVAAVVVGYFILVDNGDIEKNTSIVQAGRALETAIEKKAAKQISPIEGLRLTTGTLRVNSTPSRAQVLLFLGTSPVRIGGVPLGVAHEFIAIAEGFNPARAVVPADRVWQNVDNTPFTAVEMPLVVAKKPATARVLGPTRLTHEAFVPSGKLGTVAIRTVPENAEVYQIVGFTPDVTIENLPTEEPIRLLVYTVGYQLQRVEINPSQWIEREGNASLEIDVALKPSD
ncbi:MAG: hypothetical protein JXA30_19235 [Deltaproteobacteria bacterium]|nr:hypothetical protein [Deltaproteobacteria bacterium]